MRIFAGGPHGVDCEGGSGQIFGQVGERVGLELAQHDREGVSLHEVDVLSSEDARTRPEAALADRVVAHRVEGVVGVRSDVDRGGGHVRLI